MTAQQGSRVRLHATPTGGYWTILPMSLQRKAKYPRLKLHRALRCWLLRPRLTLATSYHNHSWC